MHDREYMETSKIKKAKLQAKDVFPNINHMQATKRAKNAFFVPGDLDLQTCPSEGHNTSSV